ncbi:MAG: hypothetical protein N3G21_07545 [Candidatus Hydrogenedentes bacterium]|nr:hypothetical protein [Candidatus Hydrogenedentota bacterium]
MKISFSDEIAEKGRQVYDLWAKSVITVRASINISISENEEESVSQCTGMLVQPRGVAVLALSALDPSVLLDPEVRKGVMIRINYVKMIFKDDKEVNAEVLLQDKDRDIMVIRAKENLPEDIAIVSLEDDNVTGVKVLDPLLMFMQMGKIAKRTHSVSVLRVESIVDQPFLFYTVDQGRALDVLSSPFFTLEGKFVGLGVVRIMEGWKEEVEGNSMVIIMPAKQIISVIKEALSIVGNEKGKTDNK